MGREQFSRFGYGSVDMANVEKVRELFRISKMEEEYYTAAQAILGEFATFSDPAENDNPPDAAAFEAFGNDFVTFMIEQYADQFSDAEIDTLLILFQQPLMQRFLGADESVFEISQKFMTDKMCMVLKVGIEELANIGEARGSRLPPVN